MFNIARTAFVVLTCLGVASAQSTVVIPAGYDKREGNTPWRLFHRAIAFRPSSLQQPRPLVHPAFTIDMAIDFGVAAVTPSCPSWDLDSNFRRRTRVPFVARKRISFPAVRLKNGPNAFAYRFVATKPYPVVRGKNYVWDMRLWTSTLSWAKDFQYAMDAVLNPFGDRPPYVRTTSSVPCAPLNLLSASPIAPGLAGDVFKALQSVGYGPKVSKQFVFVGLSNTKFGAVSLPLDLALFGAPGCTLRSSLDFVLPTIYDDSSLFAALDIPMVASLTGQVLHLQGIMFRTASNPAGITVTDLVSARIGPAIAIESSLVSAPITALASANLGQRLVQLSMVFALEMR